MKNILLGFGFGFLLIIASIPGNHAMFDAIPLGGWGFLVLYLAFHLTFLTSVAVKKPAEGDRSHDVTLSILLYLLIVTIAFPLSVCLMSWFRWGWIAIVASVLSLVQCYRWIGKGGYFNLSLPNWLIKNRVGLQLIWLIGFCAVVGAAKSFDLLNNDFKTAGIRLLGFNIARALFVFYLGFALFQIGKWMLTIGRNASNKDLPKRSLEWVILCIPFGGALGTIVMFVLGLAHLYYSWLAFLVALPIVWWSGRWIVPTLEKLFLGMNQCFNKKSFFQAFPLCLLTSALLVGVILTFIGKGIWPGDAGGDVYSHYLPYYRAVIAQHGLEPNPVWYHYYVSKGAGLFFLAMLLVDGLGGQLVTLLFHFVAAVIIYDLVTSATKVRLAGLLATLIFICVYIPVHTWGIFQKHHVLMGSGLLFTMWFSTFLGRQKSLQWSDYAISGSVFAAAFSLQFPTATALLVPFFWLLGLRFVLTNRTQAAKSLFLFSGVSIIAVCGLIVFNQLQTGMGMETPTRIFWSIANQQKFSQWVSPYLMVYLNEGSGSGVGTLISPIARLTHVSELIKLLRIEYLWVIYPPLYPPRIALVPLFILTVVLMRKYRENNISGIITVPILLIIAWISSCLINQSASASQQLLFCLVALALVAIMYYPKLALSCWRRNVLPSRQSLKDEIIAIIALIALAWLMANVVDQPVSIYRMFSFLCAISIIAGVSIWTFLLIFMHKYVLPKASDRRIVTIGLLLVAVVGCCSMLVGVRTNIQPWIEFSLGRKDAQNAIASTLDPVRKQPSVWSPYLRARQLLGLETPILTFGNDGNLIGTSFSFPGVGLQNEVSYSLGPEWHTIVFGSPDEAERELKRQNINYFLIDWRYEYLFGGIPFSPLFSPTELLTRFSLLADYKGVWLLGWKGGAGRALTPREAQKWDLVRTGCMAFVFDSKTTKALSAKYDEIIKVCTQGDSISLKSADKQSQIIDRLIRETGNVLLSSSLTSATAEAIMPDIRNGMMDKLQVLFCDKTRNQDTLGSNDISSSLANSMLESIRTNVLSCLCETLEIRNRKEYRRTIRELYNHSVNTRKMKRLYGVVGETYMYNNGRTEDIRRKPGLEYVTGWQ